MLDISQPVGTVTTSGSAAYYAQGREAYDAGERWLTACPHAEGSWQRNAWQAGFWARRSECLLVVGQVRGV